MKVRLLILGLVGAAMGWLEPPGEEMADVSRRPGAVPATRMDEIAGSRSSGFRSEGARFYTWQPERAEVVSWVAELAPFDRPGAARRG